MAPPFREAEFDIEFGHGISRIGELVDLATQHNVLVKSGSWYSFDGEQLAQGREKTKELLKENAELSKKVEAKLWETIKASVPKVDDVSAQDADSSNVSSPSPL